MDSGVCPGVSQKLQGDAAHLDFVAIVDRDEVELRRRAIAKVNLCSGFSRRQFPVADGNEVSMQV